MEIKGFLPLSLLDYSGKTSAVIFLPNCDFRCPYCQNPDLIKNPEKLATIPLDNIMEYLKEKRKWIDGVVITGGEPTIHKELPELIKKIKELGFLVKIFTNGNNPKMLGELIDNKLIDSISMDVKAPIEKYDEVVGVEVNKDNIKKSVEIIKNSGMEYSFHTTVVPKFFKEKDAIAIAEWLKDAKCFILQQFRPEKILDENFKEKPYSVDELKRFVELMKEYFEEVKISGI